MGLSKEQQAQLFHAFTQVDDSMTRKAGGTGLGLAISKQLAHLMGGEVGVISVPGQGSTFWATIRVARSAIALTPHSAITESPREALLQHAVGARVLVVEDEPFNQEIAQCMLGDAGLFSDIANDGQEAVDCVRTGNYALILMDMQMPVMNGLEATRAIRAMPGKATLPIVAMTANAFDEDREKCLAAGMNDYISKPVTADVLYGCLLKWLRKSGSLSST
jgi:CheY-like chemotaxis protein